jgi:hypothetical protein
MLKKLVITAAVVGAVLTFAPISSADPNPHMPDGQAGYCPGGERSSHGGVRYCLGLPFANGAFYAQRGGFGAGGPFGPWAWFSGATCSVMVNGSIQGGIPYGGIPDCGGGPQHLN